MARDVCCCAGSSCVLEVQGRGEHGHPFGPERSLRTKLGGRLRRTGEIIDNTPAMRPRAVGTGKYIHLVYIVPGTSLI